MPSILWYAQNSQCVQNSILFCGKHSFSQFFDKFLEVMEYRIYYMLSLKCEQSYFKKLRLGHKFSQFVYTFQIGIF